MLHVSRFACTATQRGRSTLVEPLAEKTTVFEEGLLVLASVEAGDERAPSSVVSAAAAEVRQLATRVGARRVLLHPFAHLFGEPCPVDTAVVLLDGLCEELRALELEASRSAFGWFFSWELSAKGHPLSRVARRVRAASDGN